MGHMRDFFATQKRLLISNIDFEPFAVLFTVIDDLYEYTFQLAAENEFGRFALMAHKSFLTAASLIAQTQPDDAMPITRRAVEMIKVAAAAKDDPAFMRDWLAFDKRHARWQARQKGEKPNELHIKIPVRHPVVASLMHTFGILSDSGTHFSPEYYASLPWGKRPGEIFLNYFTRNQRMIENAILYLTATHLQILQVLDYCLNGKPAQDKRWVEMSQTLYTKAQHYQKQYAAKYGIQPDSKLGKADVGKAKTGDQEGAKP